MVVEEHYSFNNPTFPFLWLRRRLLLGDGVEDKSKIEAFATNDPVIDFHKLGHRTNIRANWYLEHFFGVWRAIKLEYVGFFCSRRTIESDRMGRENVNGDCKISDKIITWVADGWRGTHHPQRFFLHRVFGSEKWWIWELFFSPGFLGQIALMNDLSFMILRNRADPPLSN